MHGFRVLEKRGGCDCARVYDFPILLYFLRSITRPLVREEERLAHIAELACGRFGAEEEKSQEREKDGTSGVHGGGYFAPHGTNNIMARTTFHWVLDFYLRAQYSRSHGRPITYLMGGSIAEAHSSSYFCLSRARTASNRGRSPLYHRLLGLWVSGL